MAQTAEKNSQSWPHKAAHLIRDYWIPVGLIAWPIVANFGIALLSGNVAQLVTGEMKVARWVGLGLFLLSAAVYVPTIIASLKNGARLSSLERSNAEQKEHIKFLSSNLFSFLNSSMLDLATRLNFGNNGGNTERITIYAHDSSGFFTALARFSTHPDYRLKSRNQYETDSGCIGEAWKGSWYFKDDYPDPKNLLAWIARCRKDGMKHEVAQNIRMKSRLYCGYRVDSHRKEPLAVVVVESTDPNRYSEDELLEFFQSAVETIRATVEHFGPSLPRVAMAREAGF